MANHLDLEEQEQLDQLKHFWNAWGNTISSVALAVAVALAARDSLVCFQRKSPPKARRRRAVTTINRRIIANLYFPNIFLDNRRGG